MDQSADHTGFATLIGDLKGSKLSADRRALQRRLSDALALVNARLPALQPLEITLGDEFQGMYATLDEALAASLLVQLGLGGGDCVRIGIGTGHLTIYEPDRAPFQQDGPAWWAAREAIELAGSSGIGLLTSFRGWDRPTRSAPGHWAQLTLPGFERELPDPREVVDDLEAIVNALLATRDAVVRSLDERDCRIILLSLAGHDQSWISEQEGISQPAVSQRLRRSGGHALLRSFHLLTRGMP